MNRTRHKQIVVLAAAVALTVAVHAQRGYRYMRPLENVPAGWNQLALTGDMFRYLQHDVSDIRIWRIAGKDTTEVPYVLQTAPVSVSRKNINGKETTVSLPSTVYKTSFTVEHTPQHVSQVQITIPEQAPVDKLVLYIGDTLDYRRSMEIMSRVPRHKNRDARPLYNYRNLLGGELASGSTNSFDIPAQALEHLQVNIYNHDNAPLKIDSVKVSGPQYRLMARFPAAGNYLLVYGNPGASSPAYDIVNFNIPDKANEIKAGGESAIPQPAAKTEKSEPFFKNKFWLYGLMGLLVLILGGFTLGMMRNKDKEDAG